MENKFCKERSLAWELSISSVQLNMAKLQRRRRLFLKFTPTHIMHVCNHLESHIEEKCGNV